MSPIAVNTAAAEAVARAAGERIAKWCDNQSEREWMIARDQFGPAAVAYRKAAEFARGEQ